MLKRITHVNLSVDDVEAARRFYGEVLGLEEAHIRVEEGSPLVGVQRFFARGPARTAPHPGGRRPPRSSR